MTDLEQQLTDHLRRRAAAATPRADLERIEQLGSLVSPVGVDDHRPRRPPTRRIVALAAAVTLVVALAGVAIASDRDDPPRNGVSTRPAHQSGPIGDRWLAFAARPEADDDVYLVRGSEGPRRVELPGSDRYQEGCPAFAPQMATPGSDAERLMIGRRAIGAVGSGHEDAELVIVDVEGNGSVSLQQVIPLDGLRNVPGVVPCAIWSPDGNWAALGGAGAVWVVNTNSGEVRRLPGYHPTDLEWRPGTDELTITGEQATREANATDAPVDVYTVSTGEIRPLGAARASLLTWSPDGTTLAFTHGEDQPDSGIWLVNADGTDERQLTEHLGRVNHGTGVTWSPDGDLIAYQRVIGCCERHEVVLVTAIADDDNPIGAERVIAPPRTETASGSVQWYPFDIVWSPDGTNLLYFGWTESNLEGAIAVPVHTAGSPIVITDELNFGTLAGTPWIPLQPWGRPSR